MNEKDILKAFSKSAVELMRAQDHARGDRLPPAVSRQLATKPKEDDVLERALAHPEVQRFQEIFPDAQVRAVRNLKE